MKIPKIKKLPSGSYFCRIRTGGRDYAITGQSYDQVYAEAVAYKAGIIKAKRQPERVTVKLAAERYIESRCNLISPSTLYEYERMTKTDLGDILHVDISVMSTCTRLQQFVNKYAIDHSPKSVNNVFRFLVAALRFAGTTPDVSSVHLPMKRKPKLRPPCESDISALISAAKGTRLELPILLAATGSLRRSEICALTRDDVTDTGVTITKARVRSLHVRWTDKPPKETDSERHATLPPFVVEKLKELPAGAPITTATPNMLTKEFGRLRDKCGIKNLRFHDLRAYWATVVHAMGMPDFYLMINGGWATMETPRKHYMRHAENLVTEQKNAAQSHFEKVFNPCINGNKNDNEKQNPA